MMVCMDNGFGGVWRLKPFQYKAYNKLLNLIKTRSLFLGAGDKIIVNNLIFVMTHDRCLAYMTSDGLIRKIIIA